MTIVLWFLLIYMIYFRWPWHYCSYYFSKQNLRNGYKIQGIRLYIQCYPNSSRIIPIQDMINYTSNSIWMLARYPHNDMWHLVYIRFAPLWWCRCGILCYFEECHFVRCHDSACILSGRRSQRHLALASS